MVDIFGVSYLIILEFMWNELRIRIVIRNTMKVRNYILVTMNLLIILMGILAVDEGC